MVREIIVKEWHDDKGLIHRREIGQELVRCKECKYFIDNLTEDDTDEVYGECCFDWDIKMPKADDFCSYGEPSSSEKPNNSERSSE